jgi:hypothetical protein
VALTLHPKGKLQPELLLPLLSQRGSVFRLAPGPSQDAPVLTKAWTRKEQEAPLLAVKALLRELLRYARDPTGVTIEVAAEPEPVKELAFEPRFTGRRRVVR